MIFTLLCIKEFVKNFPFVNKNNPTNKAQEETTEKDTIEGHTAGAESNTETTKVIFMSATLDMPLFLKYFN